MRTLIIFEDIFHWIHDRFMKMAHGILHVMEKVRELWVCWIIHVPTKSHGKILNDIE